MLGNKLLNIQFAKYHIWNNKSKGFPNMVLSIETFNQSVRTEYSEAVNARYTFQPLWVSGITKCRLSKSLRISLFAILFTSLNQLRRFQVGDREVCALQTQYRKGWNLEIRDKGRDKVVSNSITRDGG